MSKSDGSSETRVSEYGIAGDLALSPDGSGLLVADSNNNCLLLIDLASSETYCFIEGTYTNPLWSPEGNSIVYGGHSSARSTGTIYRYDVETEETHDIISHAGYSAPLDWSADGTRIAYMSSLHP